MLRRRGNFPYDFDSKFPDPRGPLLPVARFSNPSPAPPIPAPAESIPATAIPAPAESAAPPAESQASPAATSIPDPPQTKSDTRKCRPCKTRPKRRKLASANKSASILPDDPNESEASRHQRKCIICNHPHRALIEDEFLNWVQPYNIADEFGFRERILWRHARATGLTDLRRRNYRSALDLIIQRAGRATINGDTVIRAIRASACINDTGQWVEPPKRVIFTTECLPAPPSAPPPALSALTPHQDSPILELAPSFTGDPVLIDSRGRLENDATH